MKMSGEAKGGQMQKRSFSCYTIIGKGRKL